MDCDIRTEALHLRDHAFGRINRRMPIGPVRFGFHDLLWIHEGRVQLRFPELGRQLSLVAPAGVLILPETLFSGSPSGAFATASICHFEYREPLPAKLEGPGFLVPEPAENLHVQNLLRLAMHLARPTRAADLDRRRRLLVTILDAFMAERQDQAVAGDDRLAMAWGEAGRNLHRMRTLKDVADLLGVSESAFRALHRRSLGTAAGEHLRQLRLTRAEELLATTGQSLETIAGQVGYRHAATLSNAFRQHHGKTPGQFRHWSNPFA